MKTASGYVLPTHAEVPDFPLALHAVAKLARRRKRNGLDEDDLRQEAFLAMLKARRAHDPKRGRFSTLATVVLNHDLNRACDNAAGPVRLPHRVRDDAYRLNEGLPLRPLSPSQCRGRGPRADAKRLRLAVRAGAIIGGSNLKIMLAGLLSREGDPAAVAEEAEERAHLLAKLRDAVRALPPPHRKLIRRRLRGETLVEIGDGCALGRCYSRERLRQIEYAAIKKLRTVLVPAGEDALPPPRGLGVQTKGKARVKR